MHEHKGRIIGAYIQNKGNGYRYQNVSHGVEDSLQTLVGSPVDVFVESS